MSSRRYRTRRAGEDRADRSLGCASVPTCVPSCPGAGPPERALAGSQNMHGTQQPPYAALGSMCEISKAYAEASTAQLRVAPTTPRTRSQKPAPSAGKKETKWREMEGMGGQLRIFTDGLPCGAGFGVRISTCLLCGVFRKRSTCTGCA